MKLKKSLLILLALILSMSLLASCGSKDEVNSETTELEENKEVTLSVYTESEDRFVLENETVLVEEGESAFDVLLKVIKDNKLHIDYEGSGKDAYVIGIDNIYTGDEGEKSAWLFYVNGEMPEVGAGHVCVEVGDVIEWKYVLDWEKAE